MKTEVLVREVTPRHLAGLAWYRKAPLLRGLSPLFFRFREFFSRPTVSVWLAPGLKAVGLVLGLVTIGTLGHATEKRELGELYVSSEKASVRAPGGQPKTPTNAALPCVSAAHAVPTETAAGAIAGATAKEEQKVDINTAGPSEWMTLPGVGAKKAAAIIALREKMGRFRKVTDLLRVRGIGAKMLAKWKDRLVVGEAKNTEKQP